MKLSIDQQKHNAAAAAVAFVENKMMVGLGSGSTVEFALRLLGKRIKTGLQITGVPSSIATARAAKRCGIPLVSDLGDFKKLDLTIDGADEVDPQLNLIKGGGGALTREKIVATRSDRVIIMVNEDKLVSQLGKFRVPVEVLPFGWRSTAEVLRSLGSRVALRTQAGKPFHTDNGNFIVDCAFGKITEPLELLHQIKSIVGVVEAGLFVGIADLVIAGKRDGNTEEKWGV